MGGEQAAAAIAVVDRLGHRPGDGEPVIGRGAAPDLVEDNEALRARLGEDGGGLDHLDHEGRAAAGEIVGSADPAEQAVDEAEPRPRRRHEGARLGKQDDQGILAQEGRFAAHIGPGDQPQPRVFRQGTIVGDEARAISLQGVFDHRMAARLDFEAGEILEPRPAPAALGGTLGERRGDIEPGERVGGGSDRLGAIQRFGGQRRKMLGLHAERLLPGLGDPHGLLVQLGRVEADHARPASGGG